MTDDSLAPLQEPLVALQNVLDRFEEQGMIIGGVAASLLGIPRFTADIDALLLLDLEKIPDLLEAARQVGISPRIDDVKSFAEKNRVLLLKHQESGINIDISLGILPFEFEAVERSYLHKAGNLLLRLPTPEDLIILKAVANRPRVIDDIKAIAQRHKNLDTERIKLWVEAFGEALEMPELWRNIEGHLSVH